MMRLHHEWRRAGAPILAIGLAALLSGSFKAGPRQPPRAPALVFSQVTVIDVTTGERRADQTVVIVGNRIQAIGPARSTPVPAGAQIIEAHGKYLIPGLWDMHRHGHGPEQIRHGVTGVREAAMGPDDPIQKMRERVLSGQQVGPPRQVNSAGFLPRWDSNDSAAVVAYVDSAKRAGFDLIKTSGGDKRLFYILAAEARRVGIRFGGHLEETELSVFDALDSGLAVVDHMTRTAGGLDVQCVRNKDPKYQTATLATCRRAAEQMRRHDAWWIPTLIDRGTGVISPSDRPLRPNSALWPTARSLRIRELADSLYRISVLYHVPVSSHPRAVCRDFLPPLPGNWLRDSARFEPAAAPNVPLDTTGFLSLMYRAGIPLLAGTDVQAQAIHLELALMVSEGLPTLAALQTATLNPALFMHATDSLGTVAAGKLADLVLLDADPLVDITNTTTILAVVANGRYYDRATLDSLKQCSP